jgi:hypothetical protein
VTRFRASDNYIPTPRGSPDATRARDASVHIDIRQLSLHGYTPMQQQRFMHAFEGALARLAGEGRAWPTASLSLQRIDLRNAAANPEDAAQQLAQRLFDRAGAARGRNHG